MAKDKKSKKKRVKAAHKYFAVECFNKTWDYIDMAERTPDQEEEMLRLTMASHFHWTQRKDYEPANASIANWQVSRVFALLGQSDNARRYARQALEVIRDEDVSPFYGGFAYEALARAEAVAGDGESMQSYLDKAMQAAESIADEESKQMLLSDLKTIELEDLAKSK